MDCARKGAWVVQEWQQRQLQKHDPQTGSLCSLLRAFAAPPSQAKAIATDLAAHELTGEPRDLRSFFQAVESLYQRVADLLRDREA